MIVEGIITTRTATRVPKDSWSNAERANAPVVAPMKKM